MNNDNFKKQIRKTIVYLIGVFLIGFSISFHIAHGLGNIPIDQQNFIIASISGWEQPHIMTVGFMIYITLYFVKFRNKDIWVSILIALFMSSVVSFFHFIVFSRFDLSSMNMTVRILALVLSLQIQSIGTVLLVKTKISQTPLVLVTVWINSLKPFKKLNFGQARMLIDTIFLFNAIMLSLIFLRSLDLLQFSTVVALLLMAGPSLNLYLRLYNKIFTKKEVVNYEKTIESRLTQSH